MDDRTRIVAGTMLGAMIGGLATYLLLTDEGREKLSQLSPAVDDVSRVLQDVRGAVAKFGEVALEGRRAAVDLAAAFGTSEFFEHKWQ